MVDGRQAMVDGRHPTADTCSTLAAWCTRCEAEMAQRCISDPGHDIEHVRRVVANAAHLLSEEPAVDAWVVLPAAWLHDLVQIPKNDPRRAQASLLAADAARDWLAGQGFPTDKLDGIHHAIHSHSYSAQVACETEEARLLQDADRLDALGAIGIARTFLCGGAMGRPLYDADDPFATRRPADDSRWNIDHFFCKLLTLAETMQTRVGRIEARRRSAFMEAYLKQLAAELMPPARC